MDSSSPEEKKTSEADFYGQVHPVETPELIASGLSNLEAELAKIPDEEKEALNRALKECPKIVDVAHKLLFLRCEVFNADLAAARLVKYWAKRLELFGETKAFKVLNYENNYKDEDAALKIGFLSLIPKTDNTGRGIVFADPSKLDKSKYSREMMVRSVWYIFHALLETESVQQKGVVLLLYPRNAKFSQVDKIQMKMNFASIKGVLPLRLSAFHIIHPPVFFKLIFPFIKLLMGPRLRKRIRIYVGTDDDIVKGLEKFGLTPDCIPSEVGGTVILDHLAWMNKRAAAGK